MFSESLMYAGRRGETRGLMMENLMSECLDVALRVGEDPDLRIRASIRTAAWSLLDKPWKSLLSIALRRESLPERDEDGKVKRSRRPRGRQRGRSTSRRRRSASAGAESWLDDVESVLESGPSTVYRLAVLLVHRGRSPDDWSTGHDEVITELRSECDGGIHPVWGRLAGQTPLLAELAEYPVTEVNGEEGIDDVWLASARFDPLDHADLAEWLGSRSGVQLPTDISLAIQRLSMELSGRRSTGVLERELPDGLAELDGAGALIAGILYASAGDERAIGAFERASRDDALVQIADDQMQLVRLRFGETDTWLACSEDRMEDGLATARRTAAWSRSVPVGIALDVPALELGIGHLEAVGEMVPEALRWRLVEAVDESGDPATAAELASVARIADDEAFDRALRLAGRSGSRVLNDRLVADVQERGDAVLLAVIEDETAPRDVRVMAAAEILERGLVGEVWDALLSVFIIDADSVRLARTLCYESDPGSREPHATLLAWNLLPAEVDPDLFERIRSARRPAHVALSDSEPRSEMSELTIALNRLLDGSSTDLEPLNRAAEEHDIASIREARRAMMASGDGLLRADRIDQLSASIEDAGLQPIESRLFENLVIALRLNRAANDLQTGEADREKAAVKMLDDIVECKLPARYLSTIEDLVLEYETPLPSLARWYRVNRPTSPFGTVVNAAIQQAAGDRLRAARAYQEAAPHFDFERATPLYRKALIAFALAGRWSEAVDLLDRHPELAAAVTRRFQLYLRVCDEFQRDKQQSGRGKRRERNQARQLLLDFVDASVPSHPDEEEDPQVESDRRGQKEEALDMLSNYPEEHDLPHDPFVGRVRAATLHLQRRRRSRRNDQERRLRDALSEGGTPLEVVEIANDAAEEDPVRGLRMLERAMNAGIFRPRELMSLREAQQAIYTQHQPDIRIRDRRHLRNLSLPPLILVDTNLLIDALKARVQQLMSMDDVLPHPSSARAFHRMLLFRQQDNRIRLYIPAAARNEFLNRSRNPATVLALFGEQDPYIDEAVWTARVTPVEVQRLAEEISHEFSDWVAPQDEGFNATIQTYREAVEAFLVEHKDIYLRIDSNKREHSGHVPHRSEVDGMEIYPEAGDLDILRTAAALADSPMPNIGSVLIATRDADFTLVARALEENFGIGVVNNAQQFYRWMN